MRILFHRATPWRSPIHCSTKTYACGFAARGHQVAYLERLRHVGHLFQSRRGASAEPRGGPAAGVQPLRASSLLPVARLGPCRRPRWIDLAYRSCVPSLRRRVREALGGEPDVIWSAIPGSSALASLFPEAAFVFQVVDYYPAYQDRAIQVLERSDYARARHVFTIGEALKAYLVDELQVPPEKITVLGQGVSLERFADAGDCPEALRGLPRPIGLWVGVTAKADRELFVAAARSLKRQGGSLVIAGPASDWLPELLASESNVHAVGVLPPDEAAAHMRHADLGLMLYDRSRREIYRGQNPLKLYEYAAAGLPVLSTPHDEYRHLDVPAVVADSPAEVAHGIDELLAAADAYRDRSRAFAEARTWERATSLAENQLVRLLAGRPVPGPESPAELARR